MNKELKDEINELAPLLAKLELEKPSVPNGYFENFSSKLMQKIKEEEKTERSSETKVISFFPPKKYLAAAIVFIFMGLSMLLYKLEHQPVKNTNDSIDEYVQELDENSIIEYAIINTNEQLEETDHYHSYLDEESLIEEINM